MPLTEAEGIAQGIFTGLAALVCVGVGVKYLVGDGSKVWKDTYVAAVLLLMVATQYYHVLFAALRTPPRYKTSMGLAAYRHDCLKSGKGGKRRWKDKSTFALNPCFCQPPAVCLNATGHVANVSSCPTSGEYTCAYKGDSGTMVQEVPLYLWAERDCEHAKGPRCTKEEPCTSCNIATLADFDTHRCMTCTSGVTGDCNFVEDVGPYCYESPGSRVATPCTKCCTARYLNGSLPVDRSGRCIS